MFRRVIPAVALVMVMASLVSCASEAGDSAFTETQQGGEGESSEPRTPEEPDAVAEAAIEDVETYWEQVFPDIYGGTFQPPANGYHPYGPDDPPPPCGGQQPQYEVLADNAFYCDLDDYIAWDAAGLLPWLEEKFDLFTIAVVLSHEFGHVIQERVDELDHTESVRVEMQADCFAGAWTGWVDEGRSTSFSVEVDQLDDAIRGLIAFRDPPGSHPDQIGAHGAGFDRVGAFQDGFENGAEACAGYTADPPVVTQIPFVGVEEAQTGGDFYLEDQGSAPGLYTLSQEYLDYYYEQVFADRLGREWEPVEELKIVDPARDEVRCDGQTLRGEDDLEWISVYCAEENVALFDGGTLGPSMHSEIGDFAVAAELSRLWALAAQEQLGIEVSKEARLQADCITGNWAAALWPDQASQETALGAHPDRQDVYLRLSAGDLDEAIMGFMAYGRSRKQEYGNVFERTTAFRNGFYEGLDACERILPLE